MFSPVTGIDVISYMLIDYINFCKGRFCSRNGLLATNSIEVMGSCN